MTLLEALEASPYESALQRLVPGDVTYFVERDVLSEQYVVTLAHGTMPAQFVWHRRDANGVDEWLGTNAQGWIPIDENGEALE